jgi:hypothetical protein
MKRKVITLVFLLLGTLSVASAQSERPAKFEYELAAGFIFPTAFDGIPGFTGSQLLGEVRYNAVPKFDVALQYSFNRFFRAYLLDNEFHNANSHSLVALFDYNWRPTGNLNLFAGFGLGCSLIGDQYFNVDANDGTHNDYFLSLTASPRFGFEMFNRVRFTVDFKAKMSDYSLGEFSYLGLSLGYVFGGDVRK